MFDIDKSGVCAAAAFPTLIDDNYNVKWATGNSGKNILKRLMRISDDLKIDYRRKFNNQRIKRNFVHSINVLFHHLKNRNWDSVTKVLKQIKNFLN